MTSLSITEARNRLGDLVNKTLYKGERIAIHRKGKLAAVLVSGEDAQLLEDLEDFIDLKAARKALAKGGFVPLEDFLKERGID